VLSTGYCLNRLELRVNRAEQAEMAEIAGSLTKGQRGTWQELFTPRDRQIFKEIAGQTLIQWGYEKDLDW